MISEAANLSANQGTLIVKVVAEGPDKAFIRNIQNSAEVKLCQCCSRGVFQQLMAKDNHESTSSSIDTNPLDTAFRQESSRGEDEVMPVLEVQQQDREKRNVSESFLPLDEVPNEEEEQRRGSGGHQRQQQRGGYLGQHQRAPSPSQEEEERPMNNVPNATRNSDPDNVAQQQETAENETSAASLDLEGAENQQEIGNGPTETENQQQEMDNGPAEEVETPQMDVGLEEAEKTQNNGHEEVENRQEMDEESTETAVVPEDHTYAAPPQPAPPAEEQEQEGNDNSEVIMANEGDPDEMAKRRFGITARVEVAIDAKEFDKLVRKIGRRKKIRSREAEDEDDSDAELSRQLRSGANFLNRLRQRKMPKLSDEQMEEDGSDVDEERMEEDEDESEYDGDNGKPTSSSRANKQQCRKRSNGGLRVGKNKNKQMAGREQDSDDENGDSWLSKSSAGKRRAEETIKEEGEMSESGEESSERGNIPPPKITRAAYKRDKELSKLLKKANRAILDDDDEDEEGTGQSANDADYDDQLEKSRRHVVRSSSSPESDVVQDSEEEESASESSEEKKISEKSKKKKPRTKKERKSPKSSTSKSKKKGIAKKRNTRKNKNKYLASDDEEEEENEEDDEEGDGLLGSSDEDDIPVRRSAKKPLSKKDLAVETKEAEKAEKERRKRLEERQKEFNGIELVMDESCESATIVYKGEGSQPALKSIILDPDDGSEDPEPVSVHPSLVRVLKKHQAEGIKFLYDCTIESLSRLEEDGGGAILGHCMGLGKTLQIIAFLHTILSHPRICLKVNKVLVFAPKNVLLNWINEFDKWLFENDPEPELDSVFTYSELGSLTNNPDRLQAIKKWMKRKGPSVLVIGYELFRILTESEEDQPGAAKRQMKKAAKPKQKTKKQKELERLKPEFRKYLFEGPHMVICDEGHKLKNCNTSISKTINRIFTKRRVCLTGTPLQNNLGEYYCMVNFVKPNLLGNWVEFRERFQKIIERGRTVDATRYEVTAMKRRCHVLHDRLKGILDRRDYTVLKESLPPKQEYVIMIRLTPPQIELYREFLKFLGDEERRGRFMVTNHIILYRIWTHPYLIIEHEREEERKQLMQDDDDFVVTDSELVEEDDSNEDKEDDEIEIDEESSSKAPTKSKRSRRRSGTGAPDELRAETPPELKEWAKNLVTEEDRNRFELSNKLMVLLDVIKKCESIGDKLLVFSQFLNSIALIRRMLAYYGDRDLWFVDGHEALMRQGEKWAWKKGLDYDVIDGSMSSESRDRVQRGFNDPMNLRNRLLLISTRAGSLGTNLVAANRVIIFDCCWNPSHDTQSLFRVYRFGQEKPIYIYRFVAQGTMEERIYNRQVTKESTARRVTEAAQIQRHYKTQDLEEMYRFEPAGPVDQSDSLAPRLAPPKDRLLGDIILTGTDAIVSYHTHDMLFDEVEDEQLTLDEREEAWREYERERQPRPPPLPPLPQIGANVAGPSSGSGQQQMPVGAAYAKALQLQQLQWMLTQRQQQQGGAAANLANPPPHLQQQPQTPYNHFAQAHCLSPTNFQPQVMGELMGAQANDAIYRLCFQLPGMQPTTATKIFRIKQFLCYFVHLIPKDDLGEMNNSEAFNAYFKTILQQAINGGERPESVEQKVMITLATTISLAQRYPNCNAGITFILQMFPETRQHLDQSQF